MTTYRSATEFAMRFSADESGANHCKEYLLHCGERFARDFRGEEFLSLSQSIDQHCIKPESIQVSVDILGFNSDQIAPPEQLRTFHGRLAQPGNFNIIHSLYGHDAFLKESAAIDKHIRQHLEAIDENS